MITLGRNAARSAQQQPLSTRAVALLITEGVAAWVAARIIAVHGVGYFPKVGSFFTSPGLPSDVHVYDGLGYDGQFTYRLALDPFTTHLTEFGITFDRAGYRQQRILTPLLAHWAAGIPGVSTALAIVLVNALAVAIAMTAGVAIARDLGRRPQLGILLGLPAGLPISLAYDLTEPLAWAGVLLAIVAIRRKRWDLAAFAFTAALLARETSAVVYAGFVVESLWVLCRRADRAEWRRVWLVLPGVVFAAWQFRLWQVWNAVPAASGFRNTGVASDAPNDSRLSKVSNGSPYPVIGVGRTLFDGLFTGERTSGVLGVAYVVARVVFLIMIGTAAWLLITRRARVGLALTIAWSIACIIAVSLRAWTTDAQFLRAGMEAWGLSVLVLLHARHRWVRTVLAAVGVVTVWSAFVYLVRT